MDGVNVPFHLWGAHQMFARGGLGPRNDLNWFVDSGLVSIHPDGNGGIRQASFTSSKRRFKQWGISGRRSAEGTSSHQRLSGWARSWRSGL